MEAVCLPFRSDALGLLRIAHELVEVDDAIDVGGLASDPCVHHLPHGLMPPREVTVALRRRDGAEIDLHAGILPLADHRLIGVDEALDHLLVVGVATADVVRTLEDDEPCHSLLSKDVAVEALQGRLAQSPLDHRIAADTEV